MDTGHVGIAVGAGALARTGVVLLAGFLVRWGEAWIRNGYESSRNANQAGVTKSQEDGS